MLCSLVGKNDFSASLNAKPNKILSLLAVGKMWAVLILESENLLPLVVANKCSLIVCCYCLNQILSKSSDISAIFENLIANNNA